MTEARIRLIFAAYGADPLRWPEAEREAAKLWLAANGDAVAAEIANAAALDLALASAGAVSAPSAAFAARVARSAPHGSIGGGRLAAPLAALVACGALGLLIGWSVTPQHGAADASAAFLAAFEPSISGDQG